jgi:predicted neutral ceramidase superfamily lipid hydrolase
MYYPAWSSCHKISIIIMSFLIIFHIALHWEWYKTVIRKKLLSRNKLVITLAIIFIIVGVTGYIPWLVKLLGGSDWTRRIFIEVHDKITFLLFACLIIHVTKSFRWFINAVEKVKKSGD